MGLILQTTRKVLSIAGRGARGVQGFKGDPGANIMAIGLFYAASGLLIPGGTDLVQTSGHSAAGHGFARYTYDAAVDADYVTANPLSSFISSNGRGFRLAEPVVSSDMLGAKGDGVTDDTTSLRAVVALAAAQNVTLRIPSGSYKLSQGIDLSGLKGVHLDGDVTFDFTGISNAANVPGRGYISMDGGALTALPALASNTVAGTTSITLASAPAGLNVGDWINLYNPTPGSFSGFRNDYTDGQWVRVAGISGATIKLYDTILRAYPAATIEVFKHPGTSFQIEGPGVLHIKESLFNDATLNTKAGFYAARYAHVNFSKIRPTQADYAGIFLRQCVEVYGEGYKLTQSSARSAGTNYGFVAVGCQGMTLGGDWYGFNHAFVVGGGGETGDVPCRYVDAFGRFRNHPDSTTNCVNAHGHCEYVNLSGAFDGGIIVGGDHYTCSGVARGRGDRAVVYCAELRGLNIDLRQLKVETLGNPANQTSGVIDIGANASNVINASTVVGGTIKLPLAVFAPNATRGLVMQNHGCAQSMSVRFSGSDWTLAAGAQHVTGVVSGSSFADLYLDGANLGTTALQSLAGFNKIHGWELTGSITLTPPSTSTTFVEQMLAFQTPGNKVPVITFGQNNTDSTAMVGGKVVNAVARGTSSSGAQMRFQTVDSTNFTNTNPGALGYHITV